MKKTLLVLLFLAWAVSSYAQIEAIEKPNIEADKILTKTEQAQVKEYLGGKIFEELHPAKNDYVDENDRGTVEFNPSKTVVSVFGETREVFEASNYSNYKVVIPDGTILKNINFSQEKPFTESISGKNLTFIECNLTNVKIDSSWTLIRSNNTQSRFTLIDESGIQYVIQEVFKDGKWIENHRSRYNPITQ